MAGIGRSAQRQLQKVDGWAVVVAKEFTRNDHGESRDQMNARVRPVQSSPLRSFAQGLLRFEHGLVLVLVWRENVARPALLGSDVWCYFSRCLMALSPIDDDKKKEVSPWSTA